MYRGNVYTIKRVAEILGVTAGEVLELIEDGVLGYIWKPNKYSPSGEVRVIPDYEIEDYLENIGRSRDDINRTVGPMRVKIEMTIEPTGYNDYDEEAAAFYKMVMDLYEKSKQDDLY